MDSAAPGRALSLRRRGSVTVTAKPERGLCHSTGSPAISHHSLASLTAHTLQSCLTGSKSHGQGGDTGWERADPWPAPLWCESDTPVEGDKPKDTEQPFVPFLLPLLSLRYFMAKEEDDTFILDSSKQTQTFWNIISRRTPRLRGVGSQGHSRLCPLPAMSFLEQSTRTTVFSLPAGQLWNS